jgi:hypothetical protein
MSTRLINLTTILVASIASSVFAHSAVAQVIENNNPAPVSPVVPFDNFNDASTNSSSTATILENVVMDTAGDFYDDTSLEGQFNNFVSYDELEIAEAGKKLNETYNQLMKQQVGRDPVMRTRDLANPFNTSIMDNPDYLGD